MAKRPAEKYNPGELDAIRRRLGNVSREEAARMAQKLGGEVGLERTDEELAARYEKLRADALKKKAYTPGRKSPRKTKNSSETLTTDKPAAADQALPEIKAPISEMVKINYKAASVDHRLIKGGQLIQTLMRFLFKIPDKMNPKFILHFNTEYLEPVEAMVETVGNFLHQIEKSPLKRKLHPFYREILETIQEFDVAEISREITWMQKHPKEVQADSCRKLLKILYRPLVRLGNLDHIQHIQKALRKAFEINMQSLPQGSSRLENTRRRFDTASDGVDRIFSQLNYRLYPLLMKLLSPRFYEFQAFFKNERYLIMAFLALKQEDIVKIPDENLEKDVETDDIPDNLEKTESEQAEAEKAEEPIDAIRRKDGITLLTAMFPGGGWEDEDDSPDFYPYFQPLLRLPADTVLISPQDTLQRVTILLSILQELLYGFRAVKFGFTRDKEGTPAELKDKIEELTGHWHYFQDELIDKSYLTKLMDYSRQLERNQDFARSQYGIKKKSEIVWIRRKFIFPFLQAEKLFGGAPIISASAPKLQEWVPSMIYYLNLVADDMIEAPGGLLESIKNPWEPVQFAIKSPVTARLGKILKRQDREFNNCNLIISTLALLELLNHYINHEDSPAYTQPAEVLYRSENNNGNIPLYSVSAVNTADLIQKADENYHGLDPAEEQAEEQTETAPEPEDVPRAPAETSEPGPVPDGTAGFPWKTGEILSENSLKHCLTQYIAWHQQHDSRFSCIVLVPGGVKELEPQERQTVIAAVGEIITESVRIDRDSLFLIKDRFFIVLLPDMEKEAAAQTAGAIREKAVHSSLVKRPLHQAVMGCRQEWDTHAVLQHISGAMAKVADKSS